MELHRMVDNNDNTIYLFRLDVNRSLCVKGEEGGVNTRDTFVMYASLSSIQFSGGYEVDYSSRNVLQSSSWKFRMSLNRKTQEQKTKKD